MEVDEDDDDDVQVVGTTATTWETSVYRDIKKYADNPPNPNAFDKSATFYEQDDGGGSGAYVFLLNHGQNGVMTFDRTGKKGYTFIKSSGKVYFIHMEEVAREQSHKVYQAGDDISLVKLEDFYDIVSVVKDAELWPSDPAARGALLNEIDAVMMQIHVVRELQTFIKTWTSSDDNVKYKLRIPSDDSWNERTEPNKSNNAFVRKVLLRGLDACLLILHLFDHRLLRVDKWRPPERENGWYTMSTSRLVDIHDPSTQRFSLTADDADEIDKRIARVRIAEPNVDLEWYRLFFQADNSPPLENYEGKLWLEVPLDGRDEERGYHMRLHKGGWGDRWVNLIFDVHGREDKYYYLSRDSSERLEVAWEELGVENKDIVIHDPLNPEFFLTWVSSSSSSSSSTSTPMHPSSDGGHHGGKRPRTRYVTLPYKDKASSSTTTQTHYGRPIELSDDEDSTTDDDDDYDDADAAVPSSSSIRVDRGKVRARRHQRSDDDDATVNGGDDGAVGEYMEVAADEWEQDEIQRVENEEAEAAEGSAERRSSPQSTRKSKRGSTRILERSGHELQTWINGGEATAANNRYQTLLAYIKKARTIQPNGPYVRGVDMKKVRKEARSSGQKTKRTDKLFRGHWDTYGAFVYFLRGGENGVVAFDENGKEGYTLLITPKKSYFIYSPYRSPQYMAVVTDGKILKHETPPPPHQELLWTLLYGEEYQIEWTNDEHIRNEIAVRLVYIAGQKIALRTCKSFVETWSRGSEKRNVYTLGYEPVLVAPKTAPGITTGDMARATEELQAVLRRGLDACYIAVRLLLMELLTVTVHYRQRERGDGDVTDNPHPHQFYTLSTPSDDRSPYPGKTNELNRRLADLRIVCHHEPYQRDLYIRANEATQDGNDVWIIASPFLYNQSYALYVWREKRPRPTPLMFNKDDDFTLAAASCAVVNEEFRDILIKHVPRHIHLGINKEPERDMSSMQTTKDVRTTVIPMFGIRTQPVYTPKKIGEREFHDIKDSAHAIPELSPGMLRDVVVDPLDATPTRKQEEVLTTPMAMSVRDFAARGGVTSLLFGDGDDLHTNGRST